MDCWTITEIFRHKTASTLTCRDMAQEREVADYNHMDVWLPFCEILSPHFLGGPVLSSERPRKGRRFNVEKKERKKKAESWNEVEQFPCPLFSCLLTLSTSATLMSCVNPHGTERRGPFPSLHSPLSSPTRADCRNYQNIWKKKKRGGGRGWDPLVPFNKSQTLWEQQEPCLHQRPRPLFKVSLSKSHPKTPTLFSVPVPASSRPQAPFQPCSFCTNLSLPCPQAQGPFPPPLRAAHSTRTQRLFFCRCYIHTRSRLSAATQPQHSHSTHTPFTELLTHAPNHRKEFHDHTTEGQKRETWQLQLCFRWAGILTRILTPAAEALKRCIFNCLT